MALWVSTAPDNPLNDTLRYSVHRPSALRSTALTCLKLQNTRLVFDEKSDCAKAHLQQVAKFVDRKVSFVDDYSVNHSTHQALVAE